MKCNTEASAAVTQAIFDAIVSAGPSGIRYRDLAAQFPNSTCGSLNDRVNRLRRHRYVRLSGRGVFAVWYANDGPHPKIRFKGEDPAEAMGRVICTRPAPAGVPRGVPNSVFALGAM